MTTAAKTLKTAKEIREFFEKMCWKPEPLTLTIGGEDIPLFIHPLNDEAFLEVQALMGTEGSFSDDVFRLCVVKGLKDADGAPVWAKPEDIKKLPPLLWTQLKLAILKKQFHIDVNKSTAKETKE